MLGRFDLSWGGGFGYWVSGGGGKDKRGVDFLLVRSTPTDAYICLYAWNSGVCGPRSTNHHHHHTKTHTHMHQPQKKHTHNHTRYRYTYTYLMPQSLPLPRPLLPRPLLQQPCLPPGLGQRRLERLAPQEEGRVGRLFLCVVSCRVYSGGGGWVAHVYIHRCGTDPSMQPPYQHHHDQNTNHPPQNK